MDKRANLTGVLSDVSAEITKVAANEMMFMHCFNHGENLTG
jgi:hypothetical protein